MYITKERGHIEPDTKTARRKTQMKGKKINTRINTEELRAGGKESFKA